MPIRVQLKRTKGWKMPPNTVTVDRSTMWGNPFLVNKPIPDELLNWLTLPGESPKQLAGLNKVRILDPQRAIDTYTYWLIEQPQLMLWLPELRGKNLACWCKLTDLCHADVLLELANS